MILLTGTARSGTSLTTQVLGACGAKLGEVNALYEHTALRESVLKPILQVAGADPLGQYPLPDTDNIRPMETLRGAADKMLGGANTYKDAKLCLVWPMWAYAFPDAKWVIVRRDAGDIADSCLRTVFMQHYKTREDWMAWAGEYVERLSTMKPHVDFIEVWPHEAINDPDVFRPMVEHCDLTWNAEAVKQAINPSQWHSR